MEQIAITAAALVGKWAVQKAAKSAWAGLTKIYEAVKSKFSGDEASTEVLDLLEKEPTNQERVTNLAKVLEARIKADPNFEKQLASLIKEAEKDPHSGSFVTQVMDDARVGKITNIDTVHGNVSF